MAEVEIVGGERDIVVIDPVDLRDRMADEAALSPTSTAVTAETPGRSALVRHLGSRY